MLAPAVMERVTLLANHVLRSEPVATQRLLPHAGKVLQVEATGWPSLLPPLPALAWRVTPAGLLEWCGLDPVGGAELRVGVAADNPARVAAALAAGEQPQVEISGDAQFAADVSWLLQNLRWDLASDLEKVLPAPLVSVLVRVGGATARGLHAAVKALESLRDRWRARPGA